MSDDDDYSEPQGTPDEPTPDTYVGRAKTALVDLIESRQAVFYERQLQVMFEKPFFHWVTSRALNELAESGIIQSEYRPLIWVGNEAPDGAKTIPQIRFFAPRKLRFWRRRATEINEIVGRFSVPDFSAASGRHAEMLFDVAMERKGFHYAGHDVNEFDGKRWEQTKENLDRIYERDGIFYGAEIKNKLAYIDKAEMQRKLAMSLYLGLRPLFIVRAMPKTWTHQINKQGGFCLVYKFQLYPFGHLQFAREVKEKLGLPVDSPKAIQDGTIGRLLSWHLKHLT